MKILIAGCGNITGGYDSPTSKKPLTHFGAINKLSQDNLKIDVLEKNNANYFKMKKKWGLVGEHFKDLANLKNKTYDLVLIATNTAYHFQIIEFIITQKITKLIICEKPCCENLKQQLKLKELKNKFKVEIFVNYQRRLDKNWIKIKSIYESNKLGKLQAGNIYYTKGVRNNASHAINILQFLFGQIDIKNNQYKNHFLIDYSKSDPTLKFDLKVIKENKIISFNGLNEKFFSFFEIDLIFENARINCYDSGTKIIMSKVGQDNTYKSQKSLINLTNFIEESSPLIDLWNLLINKKIDQIEKIDLEYSIKTTQLVEDLLNIC